MNEKDKQIERLFDDYASSLKPNERLAANALDKMRDKKSKPKKSRAPVWIGAVAACAVVAIVVFSAMSFFGSNGGVTAPNNGNLGSTGQLKPSNPDANAPSIPDGSSQQSYTVNDLREAGVDTSFAQNYIDTLGLSTAQIVSENYYAYYLKETSEFVFFKAELEISYNGENIQMSIIAENNNFKCKELVQQYSSVIQDSGYKFNTTHNAATDSLQYDTIAYCKQDGYKYYVWAKSNSAGAEIIAADIIGVEIN